MSNIVEAILTNKLVDAQGLLENRIDEIIEQKLYEMKRSIDLTEIVEPTGKTKGDEFPHLKKSKDPAERKEAETPTFKGQNTPQDWKRFRDDPKRDRTGLRDTPKGKVKLKKSEKTYGGGVSKLGIEIRRRRRGYVQAYPATRAMTFIDKVSEYLENKAKGKPTYVGWGTKKEKLGESTISPFMRNLNAKVAAQSKSPKSEKLARIVRKHEREREEKSQQTNSTQSNSSNKLDNVAQGMSNASGKNKPDSGLGSGMRKAGWEAKLSKKREMTPMGMKGREARRKRLIALATEKGHSGLANRLRTPGERAINFASGLRNHEQHPYLHAALKGMAGGLTFAGQVGESISPNAGTETYIHDFVHSKNKRFKGKSKKERIRMALGAYYAKHQNEETINEISKDRAGNYVRSSSSDMSRRYHKAPKVGKSQHIPTNGQGIMGIEGEKYFKREKGIDTAIKKLTGKAKVNATEETINEVSKDRLAKYISKIGKMPSFARETPFYYKNEKFGSLAVDKMSPERFIARVKATDSNDNKKT